jgi:hypothetical protein
MKLEKMRLIWIFLSGLVLAVIYFFIITSFFQGWRNANFYDLIPDSLTLIAFTFLFFYSFKLKNRNAGRFIFLGALLSMLDRMIQIILEEYISHVEFVSAIWWIPGAWFGFIGLILIFIGFKEVIR